MQEKQSMDVGTCPITAAHETIACVPVSICTFAEPGTICVENCGEPVIRKGTDECCGCADKKFEFTVSQKLKVNIPIAFGADVVVGETYVSNGQTTGVIDGDCCSCNCSPCCEEEEF